MPILRSKISKARRRREKAFNELNKWEKRAEKALGKVEELKEELGDIK